jgi:phosphatidylserine decarboxylase
VNVCSPSNGATVTSPVQINAAATVSGGVYRFELWNGSTKLLSEDNGIMDQSLSLTPGSYHLTFDARSSSGTHEYATRDITVQ